MNNKLKTLIIFTLFFIQNVAFSQVRIGDFRYQMYKFDKLNNDKLSSFTDSKTTFILPNFFEKDDYRKILDEVWDITPYEIVFKDELSKSDTKISNFSSFKSLEIVKTKSSGLSGSYIYNILDFYAIVNKSKSNKKKPKIRVERVATVYFTPDIEIKKQVLSTSGDNREITGDLLNFRLGYLKNYLQLINNNLKNNSSIDIYDSFNSPELKNLSNKTLYIDSNLLRGFNPFNISEKKSPEIEKLTKDYTFSYELINYSKLEEMIFNENNDFYYLMFNQINSNKIINIVNGKTGNIVYQDHTTVSYNIKPKDFKKIDSKIKKHNKY